MLERKILRASDSAIIWSVVSPGGGLSFETWIKMLRNPAKKEGEIFFPDDEDFGVWAWSFMSLEKAVECFEQIERGERKIRPMTEEE